MTEAEIEAIIDPAMKIIPKPKQVFDEALKNVPANKLEPVYVRSHFSDAMVRVAGDALAKFIKVYLFEVCTPAGQMFLTEKYSAWFPSTTVRDAGAT